MLEVEMKFPAPKAAPALEKLYSLGYRLSMSRKESDLYFNGPNKDFAKTDEVLRIRTINDDQNDPGEEKIEVTYKGPKRGDIGKVRTEIEFPLGSGQSARKMFKMFEALGFVPTKRVVKERFYYRKQSDGNRITVTYDDVEGLGNFFELEVQIKEDNPELYELALHDIKSLATKMGLLQDERRSYIELLLAKG